MLLIKSVSFLVTGTILFWATLPVPVIAQELLENDVFVSGEGGYHTYRIPSLVVTNDGTLLAFCEGRKKGASDTGDIDLVMRRSTDRGATWQEMRLIHDDGGNTCGNPCAVVDRDSGTIWLLMTWNSGQIHESNIQPGWGEDSRRVFVTCSRDDGRSWQTPAEITSTTKAKDWSWYATGPGCGIQIQHGPWRGRLVIPCDHKRIGDTGTRYFSHVIYSDDRGTTWKTGGSSPRDQVNECEVVELTGGRLMLNMRNYDRKVRARHVCISDDGGITWKNQRHDPALIEPTCQASIRRLRWPAGDRPGVILFSNPASRSGRTSMTVRASYDDGKSWPDARLLHAGDSAYSCLAALNDGSVGCLFEKDGYRRITFTRFNLEWLARQE